MSDKSFSECKYGANDWALQTFDCMHLDAKTKQICSSAPDSTSPPTPTDIKISEALTSAPRTSGDVMERPGSVSLGGAQAAAGLGRFINESNQDRLRSCICFAENVEHFFLSGSRRECHWVIKT